MTKEKLSEILADHAKWATGESGSRANLSDADLSDADLSRANLSDADLSRANLSRANLSGANLSGANLSRANLSRANLSRANLSGANLSGADLSRADLSDADLSQIRNDFFSVLNSRPNEVEGLELALRENIVDGSTYEGECACLVGTIGNLCHLKYDGIPGLKPDSSRPAERWFLAISPSCSVKHPVVEITLGWIKEWRNLREQKAVQ